MRESQLTVGQMWQEPMCHKPLYSDARRLQLRAFNSTNLNQTDIAAIPFHHAQDSKYHNLHITHNSLRVGHAYTQQSKEIIFTMVKKKIGDKEKKETEIGSTLQWRLKEKVYLWIDRNNRERDTKFNEISKK